MRDFTGFGNKEFLKWYEVFPHKVLNNGHT